MLRQKAYGQHPRQEIVIRYPEDETWPVTIGDRRTLVLPMSPGVVSRARFLEVDRRQDGIGCGIRCLSQLELRFSEAHLCVGPYSNPAAAA